MAQSKHYSIIDGSYLMHSTYYVTANKSFDKMVQAQIFRFYNYINNAENPIAVFDSPKSRATNSKILENYKGNRKETNEIQKQVFSFTQKMVKHMGTGFCLGDKIEADQVIGSFALDLFNSGHNVTLVTIDKDFNQLLKEKENFIRIYDPSKNDYRKVKDIIERYGIPPSKFATFLALTGDRIDNVPGLAGCGEKSAAKFIQEFGSFKKIKVGVKEKSKTQNLTKLEAALLNDIPNLNKCYKVVKLKSLDLELPKIKGPDKKALIQVCKEYDLSFNKIFGNLEF